MTFTEPTSNICRNSSQTFTPEIHGIAWLMCVRLGDEEDNDSLFSRVWWDVLDRNYFDGTQLKWVATMLNPLSDISRPATL